MNETLFGNWVFADVVKLKPWYGYEKRGIWTQRQRGRGKMAMWRLGCRLKCWIHKAREHERCWHLLDVRSNKEGLFPRDLGERRTLPTAWYWKFIFHHSEWLCFCCSKLLRLWYFVMQRQETNGMPKHITQSLCKVPDTNSIFNFQNAWLFSNYERAVHQIEADSVKEEC